MSEMSDEARRLDGNAAAGVLSEIFAHEMTSAESTCGGCGRSAPLGGLMLYGSPVGTILRCPSCDRVLLRINQVREEYWLDMRGMTVLRVRTRARGEG
jgi:hypothetical protein